MLLDTGYILKGIANGLDVGCERGYFKHSFKVFHLRKCKGGKTTKGVGCRGKFRCLILGIPSLSCLFEVQAELLICCWTYSVELRCGLEIRLWGTIIEMVFKTMRLEEITKGMGINHEKKSED